MVALVEPVSPLADKKPRGPSAGIGIAFSGGGYRAMLFHVGAFLRLYELGLLRKASRISSVSGGSITSAKVALEWDRLKTRDDFFENVVGPIRRVAGTTIDIPAIASGLVLPGRVADYVALAYRSMLFGRATLQDLPAKPEFVINATNVETGTLWRFSRAVMADYKVGEIDQPTLPLAAVVAASSAFPPFLSPYLLRVSRTDFSRVVAKDEALLSDISLADGGVYDNLGLETVWKAYRNVLVSDAGAALQPNPAPSSTWAGHRHHLWPGFLAPEAAADRVLQGEGGRARLEARHLLGDWLRCRPLRFAERPSDTGRANRRTRPGFDAAQAPRSRAPGAADQLGLRDLRHRAAQAFPPAERSACRIPLFGRRLGQRRSTLPSRAFIRAPSMLHTPGPAAAMYRKTKQKRIAPSPMFASGHGLLGACCIQ
jgi:NTE family protein